MRIRRIFVAVFATAALSAGVGLAGAATAQGAPSVVTPSECQQGGGTADLTTNTCKGGMYDGEQVD
ncbi:hypothetical protein DEJ50_29995 [Streptomyces venezuelae]|uniref:Uncharacterized protein n=1 Tax=Streptomyces venezuelae TaxID=54571 RepID=A0A5P2DBG8_STRVZ|nr:hypothetical protein [Streptomyces venezuelae]QES51448.1 hypothetical protein DEJ50_29995 [Streptomyces venezuelae]